MRPYQQKTCLKQARKSEPRRLVNIDFIRKGQRRDRKFVDGSQKQYEANELSELNPVDSCLRIGIRMIAYTLNLNGLF